MNIREILLASGKRIGKKGNWVKMSFYIKPQFASDPTNWLDQRQIGSSCINIGWSKSKLKVVCVENNTRINSCTHKCKPIFGLRSVLWFGIFNIYPSFIKCSICTF